MEHSILLEKNQTQKLNQKTVSIEAPKSKIGHKGKILNETNLSFVSIGAFGIFLFAVGLSLWLIAPIALLLIAYISWSKFQKDMALDISFDESIASAIEKDLFHNQG